MSLSYCLAIDHPSRVAESRRLVTEVARSEGLSEQEVSNASIVASELASNLSKHAKRGELHVLALSGCGRAGVEIISIDHGPGIANLKDSFVDGHSSAGTAGTGLGAIRRLSGEFDVHSIPNSGTVLVSRIFAQGARAAETEFSIGVVTRPLRTEAASGDGWVVRFEEDGMIAMVADGLGHGMMAHDAANAAIDAFQRSEERAPDELIRTIHHALRGSRGAAVAVARVDVKKNQVGFAGLGNIAGILLHPGQTQTMVSHYGTAGHEARQIREFVYPWSKESILVMHTDGLSTNWNHDAVRSVRESLPSLMGAVLYRDFGRDRDDACVLVGKMQ